MRLLDQSTCRLGLYAIHRGVEDPQFWESDRRKAMRVAAFPDIFLQFKIVTEIESAPIGVRRTDRLSLIVCHYAHRMASAIKSTCIE